MGKLALHTTQSTAVGSTLSCEAEGLQVGGVCGELPDAPCHPTGHGKKHHPGSIFGRLPLTAAAAVLGAVLLVTAPFGSSAQSRTQAPPEPIAVTHYIPGPGAIDLNGDGAFNRVDGALARRVALAAAFERTLRSQGAERNPWANESDDRLIRDRARWLALRAATNAGFDLTQLTDTQLISLEHIAGFVARLAKVNVAEAALEASAAQTISNRSDEIDALNLQAFASAGVKPIFVTDLDDTAWQGHVTDYFAAFMAAGDKIKPDANPLLIEILTAVATDHPGGVVPIGFEKNSPKQNARLILQLHADGVIDGYGLFKTAAALTAGFTDRELVDLGRELFAHGSADGAVAPFDRRIYDAQKRKYHALTKLGVEAWIVSSGLDFLARAGIESLGLNADHVRASTLEMVDGRSTGRYAHNVYFVKDEATLDLINEANGVPVACYADSASSDTPMGILVDLVDRVLDPNPDDPRQNALRAEFKETPRRSLEETAQWVRSFNSSHGTRFEAHPMPKTVDEAR